MGYAGQRKCECEVCLRVNGKHASTRGPVEIHAKYVGKITHTDTPGPLPVESKGGCKYQLVCIDEFTGHSKVYNMRSKTQAYAFLEKYRAHMQQLGHTLEEFRADCGTEYFNKVVDAWCTQHRLHFTAPAPYRHQDNGRSERHWKSLWNNIRASIADMSQDRDMWTYASPYQVLTGKEFDHTRLRVPFSAVYPVVEGVRRTTHDDKR